MLQIINAGLSLPESFLVDPNAEFQPGQIAQLNKFGIGTIVCGVSDGTAPIGLIDDIKSVSFTRPSIDEVVMVPAMGVQQGSRLVTGIDILAELENPHITPSSFWADIDIILSAKNGNIIIPAGTELNFDQDGDGIEDSVRVVCNYMYQIPNIPGDDSTQGTGRITVWTQRVRAATSVYETNQKYVLNANLYVSESGLLTSRRPSENHSPWAMVTAPPTSVHSFLEFLWF